MRQWRACNSLSLRTAYPVGWYELDRGFLYPPRLSTACEWRVLPAAPPIARHDLGSSGSRDRVSRLCPRPKVAARAGFYLHCHSARLSLSTDWTGHEPQWTALHASRRSLSLSMPRSLSQVSIHLSSHENKLSPYNPFQVLHSRLLSLSLS